MTTKERVAYNQSLFKQIKNLLPLAEETIYDHNIIFKDCYGNFVKIEIVHFKDESGYKGFQERKDFENACRREKERKKNGGK